MTATFSAASKRWWRPSLSSAAYRRIYDHYEKQLVPLSAALANEFRRAAEKSADLLTPAEMGEWAEEGLALARQSWRSWEAATEYFRGTPLTLSQVGLTAFRSWAQYGRELAETSSALAAAYYRASPHTLAHVASSSLADWAALGRQLYKGTWRSASLAVQFFDNSPALFSQFSLEGARGLV